MPDKKISELDPGTPPAAADLIPVVQGGDTMKVGSGDYQGPLLPGWDATPAARGPTAQGQFTQLRFSPVNLAPAALAPMSIGTADLEVDQPCIVLVYCILAINSTAVISTPFKVLVSLTSGNDFVINPLEMAIGQVVTESFFYAVPMTVGTLAVDVFLQLTGNPGTDLFIETYYCASSVTLVALPAVQSGSVSVLRNAGCWIDGSGHFMVDEAGDFIVF